MLEGSLIFFFYSTYRRAGPPRLKQLVIDCCKSNPNDRPDFKEALNIIRDIQKEVDLEDSRGDRGRSASVTQYNPYDRAGERDRYFHLS